MLLATYIRRFDYRLWILGLGWVVSALGFAVSIPFMTIYFHSELNISMTNIGIFFGVAAIIRALFQSLGGELSDKYGRYYPMVLAQVFRTVVFFVTAYAIYRNWGFYRIGALIILNSIFGSLFQPAANATVADLVAPELRTDGYSVVRVAGNLGWALGPALGGFLAERSFALLFLLSGCMTLISSLVIAVFLRGIRPRVDRINEKFRYRDIFQYRGNELMFQFALVLFIMYLVVSQFMAPLSLYVVDYMGLLKSQLGMIFAVNGFMVIVFQIPVTRLVKGFRLTTMLIVGAAIYTLGYFYIGLTAVFWGFVIAMVIITCGELLISPSALTIPANLAPPGRTGRYMGLYGLAVTLGWSMGPLFGGLLMDVFKPEFIYFWILVAGTALVAALMFGRFAGKIPLSYNLFRDRQ
jgi:MFS family permease